MIDAPGATIFQDLGTDWATLREKIHPIGYGGLAMKLQLTEDGVKILEAKHVAGIRRGENTEKLRVTL